MLDASSVTGKIAPPGALQMHMNDRNCLFQPNSYQNGNPSGVVNPFSNQHMNASHPNNGTLQQSPNVTPQQPLTQGNSTTIGQSPHTSNCVLPQLSHGLSCASQSLAAALFVNSRLISDDLKLAAAAAAAVVQSRGKKLHRAEPVPQSGFKGVSWNSRMKAWLAFYVTDNGERKSKTFSTRKLGMEEARLQAIAFCKQKQDQRREARKRSRDMHNQQCNNVQIHRNSINSANILDPLSSDESMLESNDTIQDPQQHAALRCGYPTTPGLSNTPSTACSMMTPTTNGNYNNSGEVTNSVASSQTSSSEVAYIPIVPIAMDMIEKSGLLQPLELSVLPPCQHCSKQPYPFLMIVSEGQEQTYSGSSIMNLTSHHHSNSSSVTSSVELPSEQQQGSHSNISHSTQQTISNTNSGGNSVIMSVEDNAVSHQIKTSEMESDCISHSENASIQNMQSDSHTSALPSNVSQSMNMQRNGNNPASLMSETLFDRNTNIKHDPHENNSQSNMNMTPFSSNSKSYINSSVPSYVQQYPNMSSSSNVKHHYPYSQSCVNTPASVSPAKNSSEPTLPDSSTDSMKLNNGNMLCQQSAKLLNIIQSNSVVPEENVSYHSSWGNYMSHSYPQKNHLPSSTRPASQTNSNSEIPGQLNHQYSEQQHLHSNATLSSDVIPSDTYSYDQSLNFPQAQTTDNKLTSFLLANNTFRKSSESNENTQHNNIPFLNPSTLF